MKPDSANSASLSAVSALKLYLDVHYAIEKMDGNAGRKKMSPEASNVYRIENDDAYDPIRGRTVFAINCFYKYAIHLGLKDGPEPR